jgi:hypothetical protein
MTPAEIEAILTDSSKSVSGDISWSEDEDHSPAVEFKMPIDSTGGYPIWVKGSYNALAKTLSYAVIHRPTGRIYGLDLGKDHKKIGEMHKHRDKDVYVPDDITAPVTSPVDVWR